MNHIDLPKDSFWFQFFEGSVPAGTVLCEHCILCGKPIENPKTAWWVLVGKENQLLLPENRSNPDEDYGRFPIGPDCYRKHPEFRGYGEKGACVP